MDVIGAALLLVATAPLMIVAMLATGVTTWRSPIFRQTRTGLHGELFTIYKIRTMTDARDPNGVLLPDGERLTRLGNLIREWSIDELPQLCNVLRGEMSLVGPRPLLRQYLERYTPTQRRRHEVKPGITGWSAVNGRNAGSWQQSFELDVYYVDHWSLWLDFKIVAKTVYTVLSRRGVRHKGHPTMPEFMTDEIRNLD